MRRHTGVVGDFKNTSEGKLALGSDRPHEIIPSRKNKALLRESWTPSLPVCRESFIHNPLIYSLPYKGTDSHESLLDWTRMPDLVEK